MLTQGELLTSDCLPDEIKKYSSEPKTSMLSYSSPSISNGADGGLKNASIEAEKEAIFNALITAKYNKSKAAELLNIDRKTLYNKIKQYNIEVDI